MTVLAVVLFPVGLAVLGSIVALAIDATRQDRASRRRAAALRETAPILPWPGPDTTPSAVDGLRVNAYARGERGETAGRFLRNLTMVCFAVVVFSGLVVYWIDAAAPHRATDHPPAARGDRHATQTPRLQPAHDRLARGGGGCG